MEAIRGRKTIPEIAADHAIHPNQVSQWKRQLLDGASELLSRGKKTKARTRGKPMRLSCSNRPAACRWSWNVFKKSSLL
jgi:putative transposase